MTSDSLPETSGDAAPVLPGDAALSHDPAYIDYATRMLGDAELTDGLRAPQLARLATIGAARSYGPHELICDEQERSDELYIVQDGTVEVLLDPRTIGRADADNRRIAVIGAGQTCGELALLDGGVRSARLRAGGDGARLMAFRRDALLTLCERDTAIGFRIMFNLAGALGLRLRLQDMKLYEGE
jgi:CRP-like cAMP-binding protein